MKMQALAAIAVVAMLAAGGGAAYYFLGDRGGGEDHVKRIEGQYTYSTYDHLDDIDIEVPAFYDDSYLLTKATGSDPSLRMFALNLSLSTGTGHAEKGHRADSVVKFMSDIGCTKIQTNGDYDLPYDDLNAIPVTIGVRTIDGKTCLFVANCGVRYGAAPFASNLIIGESGPHQGFDSAKTKVVEYISQYIQENGIAGGVKILAVGYSRAAAITNLVGKEICDAIAEGTVGTLLSDSISLAKDDAYFFCFETPLCAPYTGSEPVSPTDSRYDGIQHINNPGSIVSRVPANLPSDPSWNFVRYGRLVELPVDDEEKREAMVDMAKRMFGSDVGKGCDVEFKTVGDFDSPGKFSEAFTAIVFERIGSRAVYAQEYQDDLAKTVQCLREHPKMVDQYLKHDGGTETALFNLILYHMLGTFEENVTPKVQYVTERNDCAEYTEYIVRAMKDMVGIVRGLNPFGQGIGGALKENFGILIYSHMTTMTAAYLALDDPNYK